MHCLYYIQNVNLIDTIKFTKTTRFTDTFSLFVDKNVGSLYIMGTSNNPDEFPVIFHSKRNAAYSFLINNNIYFERVTLTGDTCFYHGQSKKTVSLKQCVIKDLTSRFFDFEGDGIFPEIIIENCLFVNNADTIFRFNYWSGGAPKLKLINSTFDNCKLIFGIIDNNIDKSVISNSLAISNCIFKASPLPDSLTNVKNKISYSLFDIPMSGLGVNCIANADPKFAGLLRNNPSDWKLLAESPAVNKLDTINAPMYDIRGERRTAGGKADLGCWEYAPPQITANPVSDTVKAGVEYSFSITAKNSINATDTLTYRWFKVGSTDTLSYKSTYEDKADTSLDSTQYYCVVSNSSGAVISNKAILRVYEKPKLIVDLLTNKTKYEGDSAVFTITAKSAFPIKYQWYRIPARETTGILIPNESSHIYVIKNVAKADSGSIIYCEASVLDDVSRSKSCALNVKTRNDSLSCIDYNASLVNLKWITDADDPWQKARIWYDTAVIPFSADSTELLNTESKNPPLIITDTETSTKTVTGLQPETSYYFGLQLQRNEIWSTVSKKTSCKVTTQAVTANTIKITDSYFDTTTNKIIVKFTFDSTGSGKTGFKAGYTFGKSNYNDSAPVKELQLITKMSGSAGAGNNVNVDTIDFGEDFDFGTETYYVSLWVKSATTQWSNPTDSSKFTVEKPELRWMAVNYFPTNKDTVTAFGHKIVLRKGSQEYRDQYQAKLDIVDHSGIIPEGFIPVSIATKIRNILDVKTSPEIHFGIRADSIPSHYSSKDVKLYEYDTLKAKWNVIYSQDIANDKDNLLISASIVPGIHPYPIIAMIDTLRPKVVINSDTSILTTGNDVNINVLINDNVANLTTFFKQETGAKIPVVAANDSGMVSDDAVTLKISSSNVNDNSGVRAFYVVSDGHFTDTFNLSRRVYNTNLAQKTEEMKWYPLCTHYTLGSKKVQQLFDSLSGPDKQYDITKFRIFKWYSYEGNQSNVQDKWVEYSTFKDNDSLFDLTPGNLVWLKTRKPVTLNFEKAVTLSLKDTIKIKLKANSWNDFCVPFYFPIKIQDILKASRVSDTLLFCKWTIDSIYKSTFIHNPLTPNLGHPEAEITGDDGSVYSVYNSYDKDIELRFPPTPSVMSAFNITLNKNKAEAGWSSQLTAYSGKEQLTPLFFGYSDQGEKNTLIPPAPSFSKIGMRIVDDGKTCGIHISHEKNNGYAYDLRFDNDELSSRTITCFLEGELTSDMIVKVFNPASGIIDDISSGFNVKVEGQSSEQRWLLVGDNNFVNNFVQSNSLLTFNIMKLYPNPFRGTLNIKYMIPHTGVSTVNCMLFNSLGRRIWNFKIDKVHPGVNTFTWQPGNENVKALASGSYFLQLTAKDAKGKETNSKQAKLMYLSH